MNRKWIIKPPRFQHLINNMRYLFFCLLIALALGAYNTHNGLDLAYFSKIAYDPIASITGWNCGSCSRFKMTDVIPLLFRSKHSRTVPGICKVMWGIAPPMALLLWHSGDLPTSKIGLVTLMPHKLDMEPVQAVMCTEDSPTATGLFLPM